MSQRRTTYIYSRQLAQKLESDRSIKLSPDRLRQVLKKGGLFGNEPERATKPNKTQKVVDYNRPM